MFQNRHYYTKTLTKHCVICDKNCISVYISVFLVKAIYILQLLLLNIVLYRLYKVDVVL